MHQYRPVGFNDGIKMLTPKSNLYMKTLTYKYAYNSSNELFSQMLLLEDP